MAGPEDSGSNPDTFSLPVPPASTLPRQDASRRSKHLRRSMIDDGGSNGMME